MSAGAPAQPDRDAACSPVTQAAARLLAAAGQPVLAAEWAAPRNIGLLTTLRADAAPTAPAPCTPDRDNAAGARDALRRRLQSAWPSSPVWLDQVHGAGVVVIDAATLSSARMTPPVADAIVTRLPGVVCAVRTADCLPVALADRAGSVIGLAHAGWRGLAAGVLEATVQAMTGQHAAAGELVAWFGPAIGPSSFEVGADVWHAFCDGDRDAAAFFAPRQDDKWLADLYGLARRRLHAAGVRVIHGGGLCTLGDAQRFPSYRRDRTALRMATLLWRMDGPPEAKL